MNFNGNQLSLQETLMTLALMINQFEKNVSYINPYRLYFPYTMFNFIATISRKNQLL